MCEVTRTSSFQFSWGFLCCLCSLRETEKGLCCGCLLPFSFSASSVMALHLAYTSLRTTAPCDQIPSPDFKCVDRQHTRKAWTAAGIQCCCLVCDLISTCLSQKVQVCLDLSDVSQSPLRSAFTLVSTVPHLGILLPSVGLHLGILSWVKKKKWPAGRQQSLFPLGSMCTPLTAFILWARSVFSI